MKAETWKWTWKAGVSSLALLWHSSAPVLVKEATTDFTLCALSDLYSLFSQMLSEHHLVCEAEIGGGSNRESHLMNGERALMLLKGRRATPPPLWLFGDMVMTVTFSVTNVCDYLLGGRKCVLNKGQCDSWRSRFHFQTAFKNKEYKPAPHIDLFRLVSFLILGDLHLNLTQMLVDLFKDVFCWQCMFF